MKHLRSFYAFELLLERRFWLFLVADLFIVGVGLFNALLGSGLLQEIYKSMAALPVVLLGVPVLSSTVSLERRAGSLDLALAVPSPERYFLRRVMPVCGFFIVQAWLFTLVAYLIVWESNFLRYIAGSKGLYMLPVFVHATLLGLLVGSITLFWTSRINSSGGVMVASFLTFLALGKWISAIPMIFPKNLGPYSTWYFGLIPPIYLTVAWNLTVLALAAVLFYLYARERLRRPELMLA